MNWNDRHQNISISRTSTAVYRVTTTDLCGDDRVGYSASVQTMDGRMWRCSILFDTAADAKEATEALRFALMDGRASELRD